MKRAGPVAIEKWPIGRALASGFALFWRQPILIASWAVLSLVVSGTELVGDYYFLGPVSLYDQAIAQGASAQTLLGLLVQEWKTLPIMAALYAVVFTAISRAVLSRDDRDLSYVRFGAAELKTAIGCAIVFGLLSLLTPMLQVVKGAADRAVELPVIGPEAVYPAYLAIALGGFFLVLFAAILLLAKTWLLPAALVDGEVLVPRAIWAADRGRTSRLAGTLVLAMILGVVVAMIGDGISAVSLRPAGQSAAGALRLIRDRCRARLSAAVEKLVLFADHGAF